MLSISHGTTGAYIATKLPHPLIFIPVILASHYLEDWIPHWDVGTGLSSGKRKRSTAILLEIGDLALTAVLVYFFWRSFGPSTLWMAAAGAFVGLIPDFCEAPRNFLKWEPGFLKPVNQFHNQFHHSIPNVLVGLAPQVIVIIAIYLLR